jgi:hypothetical protein
MWKEVNVQIEEHRIEIFFYWMDGRELKTYVEGDLFFQKETPMWKEINVQIE